MASPKQILHVHATEAQLIDPGGVTELQDKMLGFGTDTNREIWREGPSFFANISVTQGTSLSAGDILFYDSSTLVWNRDNNLNWDNTNKVLQLFNLTNNAAAPAKLLFEKDRGTGNNAANDEISHIEFKGTNDGDTPFVYADIKVLQKVVTAGSESVDLTIKGYDAVDTPGLKTRIRFEDDQTNIYAGGFPGTQILMQDAITISGGGFPGIRLETVSLTGDIEFDTKGSIIFKENGNEMGRFKSNGNLELNHSTSTIEYVDAGTAGATEQAWQQVLTSAGTGYIRIFATV